MQKQLTLKRSVSKTNPCQAPALLLTLFLLLMAGLTTHAALPGAVVTWGNNGNGQTTVPAGLGGVTAIEAGDSHTVALQSNGTVVAWGDNGNGQTNVPAGLNGVTAIVAGGAHTVVLKNDGTVVAWGWNVVGQTNVPVGLSAVWAIAAGSSHTVVLQSNGTVVAWGSNGNGQTNVPAGLGGVIAIAAGGSHTVALQSNGTVVAWGRNIEGQTNVPVGLNGVMAISAGGLHTVALQSNGTVVAWGNNGNGQTNVPAGLGGVIAIAAGGSHTVVLKNDGTVVAWGAGKISTGTYPEYGQSIVAAGVGGVMAIAAGGNHTVALQRVYNWTTIAGLANTPAYADGTNNSAFFNNPGGIAADGAGNVYVADFGNRVIRKISPTGSNWVTTTIAGLAGSATFKDGSNSVARFSAPSFLRLDGVGNIHVQDQHYLTGEYFIRKISLVGSNWVVTSIYRLANGNSGWAVDVSGNFYTASNYTIIRLKPIVTNGVPAETNFVATSLAGFPGLSGTADGTNIVARFSSPSVFGVDSAGTIYLTDNGKIRTVSPSGGNWVVATMPRFPYSYPVLDSRGNIYGYDYSSVYETPYGTTNWISIGGSNGITGYADGVNNSARFSSLAGVGVSPSGVLYVSDSENQLIRQGATASLPLGNIQVMLQPNEAVSAGAAWRVDAGLWQTNGATVTNLMAGSNHVLSFAPVYGWAAPSNQWVTISTNTTTSVVGEYVQQYGAVQVNLTPVSANNAGAQWQVDGGSWQNSGATISNLSVGAHTVSFTNAVGFITPASQTNVIIVPNQTAVISGFYVALGAVVVNINPAGAVSAGAQWQLDGGDVQNSGVIVSNVALGSHTISYLPTAGFITPTNQTVTVVSGQTNTVTGNYVVLGSLRVTINPAGAVGGGAQWQIDGGAFQSSGNAVSNLATGTHTISYTAATGYITPTNQTLNINPGGTTNITATYVALGAVVVNINPAGAVSAGAQWQLDGGDVQNSGVVVSNVSLGSHTISYLPTTGFITPTNQTVTVVSGQTNTVTGTYVALGSVQVTINPTNAVSSGAQWALDGGALQNSGVVLSNLALGAHTISYLPLSSWITPSNQVVTVVSGQTTNVAATYIALGSLQVFITPIGVVSAGARWQVDGGAWQASASVVSNLVAGNHTVAFTNIAGWTTPINQTVTVDLNQNTVATGVYLQQFGNLQVVLSPAGAVGEGAQWQVDGGAWQASGATITNVTVGSHTVGFASIVGWTAPTNQTATINSNQTTRLTAVYEGKGSLQVLLVPAGAVVSGAQWQVDGGAWMSNGAVVSDLNRGAHTVSFKPASGWVAPANQSVNILANQMTVTNGLYTGLGYSFHTIAGTAGSSAFMDGTNNAALFDTPVGICVDVSSNIYIADTGNSVIRKLTPTTNGWVSSTIAGLAGSPGNVDGTNSQARFDYPTGVAVDMSGNLYVADQVNATIRKITTDGTNWTVSTIAGLAGNYGSANGTNGVARFYYPAGVAVDLAGNVYVADQINSTIRKLKPLAGNNWAVTTIAGAPGVNGSTDGTNTVARFYWPSDLTVDASGIVFVSDSLNNTIRKVSPVGTNYVTTTICGVAGVNSSVDGTNNSALFDGPGGITLDARGNIFVADSYSSVIRKITPVGTSWVVNTIGGQAYVTGATDGTNSAARFNAPSGIGVDRDGVVYIADSYNQTIRAGSKLEPSPASPNIAIAAAEPNFSLNWQAQPGVIYQVQIKTDLSQGVWLNLGLPILATNTVMPFVDASHTNNQRFYRIKALQ